MSYQHRTRVGALLPTVAAMFLMSLPAAADPVFSLFTSCDATLTTGSSAIARNSSCPGLYGNAMGGGFADFGSVGAQASAVHLAQNSVTTASGVRSIFSDEVFFTSTDPNVNVTSFLVALNLRYSAGISGSLSDRGLWSGEVTVSTLFGGVEWQLRQNFNNNEDYFGESNVSVNGFSILDGFVTPSSSLAMLATPFVSVAANAPITLRLNLSASAAATDDSASAFADATRTLELPFDTDVFILPVGVTANAGNWLVNNRRVRPSNVDVPEPGTLALMMLGLCAIGGLRQGRRSTWMNIWYMARRPTNVETRPLPGI